MNPEIIKSELESCFGVGFEINYKRLPDREEIISKPVDFIKNKGFSIISTVRWLNLDSELKFDHFAGDIMEDIMKNHLDKVGIMIDSLKLMVQENEALNLSADIGGIPISEVSGEFDLTKLNIKIESNNLDLSNHPAEKYIVEHQKIILGLILLLFDLEEVVPGENRDIEGMPEGGKIKVEINKYERNRINRQTCLNYHGYNCKVCGFNFESYYGNIGVNYIHVHHLKPVSSIGADYKINPLRDLVPICPNCHSMIHRSNPPYSVSALKRTLKKQNNTGK